MPDSTPDAKDMSSESRPYPLKDASGMATIARLNWHSPTSTMNTLNEGM